MTVKELYANIGGNYQEAIGRMMMDKLISKFVIQFSKENSFNRLCKAFENKDVKEIFEASHGLKGVAANLALTEISDITGKITEATRSCSPDALEKTDISSDMAKLKRVFEKTVAEIKRFEANQS